MNVARDYARYFADENLLGMAKLLTRRGRSDVLYAGHSGVPEVPPGTPDLEWMPVVASLGLIVLSRDRRIRTRPAELALYRSLGVRSVWLGAKQDMRPQDQVDLFLKQEARLLRLASTAGPGPWALALTPSGIRRIHVRDAT